VHGILVLLNLGTDGADKLAGGILLIDVWHLYWLWGTTPLQFFVEQARVSYASLTKEWVSSSASRNDYYDRHSSRFLWRTLLLWH
jgi:hypothetical protein